jgi:hypothetical protein
MWMVFYKNRSPQCPSKTNSGWPENCKASVVFNFTLMKQIWGNLKQKIGMMMEENAATKDRTTGFRITVGALLITALFCITLYLIKTLP